MTLFTIINNFDKAPFDLFVRYWDEPVHRSLNESYQEILKQIYDDLMKYKKKILKMTIKQRCNWLLERFARGKYKYKNEGDN